MLSLLSHINQANGTNLKLGELLIGPPRETSGDYNTSVLAWAATDLSYIGGVFFSYNRRDLSAAFQRMWGSASELVLDSAGYTKLSQLLGVIAQRYSIELDPTDIVDVDLDPYAEHATVTLATSDTSYVYNGSITVYLFNSGLVRARKTTDGQLRRTSSGIRHVNQEAL